MQPNIWKKKWQPNHQPDYNTPSFLGNAPELPNLPERRVAPELPGSRLWPKSPSLELEESPQTWNQMDAPVLPEKPMIQHEKD